jgi:hypothetical protein
MIKNLVLPNGSKLENVPASVSILISMGFSNVAAEEVCLVVRNEYKLDEMRKIRQPLLIESDYLVNDATDKGIDETPFRQYRQALKNITEGLDNPDDIVWPIVPQI